MEPNLNISPQLQTLRNADGATAENWAQEYDDFAWYPVARDVEPDESDDEEDGHAPEADPFGGLYIEVFSSPRMYPSIILIVWLC